MIERLGEYRILDRLGEGGMGEVWRARQESLARDVAIKILTSRLCANPRFIQRFYREARSAAGLLHPNVIQIYTIGHDQEHNAHYFAMEYVRGKDLSQILRSGKTFSVDQALTIVLQVAEALAAAADVGIIHRDIKPGNIMLTPRGHVKVMDFGLAKMAHQDLDVTEAGTIVGTANYMSPEQGLGRVLDPRTDIYSLGIVFYELLTGRLPFQADEPAAVIYMHIHEPPRLPSKINPAIPPAVERLILRMLAKNCDERPPDPRALIAELRQVKRDLRALPPPKGARARAAAPAAGREQAAQAKLGSAAQERKAALGLGKGRRKRRPLAERARRGSVLAVDDQGYAREYFRSALESDYAVVAVGSIAEALEAMAAERPDVLVLDLYLRDDSGFRLLDEIRRRRWRVKVLAVSAHGDERALEQLEAYGVPDFLGKPVRLADLRRKVNAMVRAARAEGARPLGERTQLYGRIAEEEDSRTERISLAHLAGKLVSLMDARKRPVYDRRLRSGSPRQIVDVIHEMVRTLEDERALDLAIYSFKEGDHRVRILTCDLVARRFPAPRAYDLLSRFAADQDYRVRIAALRRIADAPVRPAAEFVARFLNDEVWKVQREAARTLERLSGDRVTATLIDFYARNEMPPPLGLQRRLKGANPIEEVRALEQIAAAGTPEVREYVAGLLALVPSGVVVPSLLRLLRDERARVRASAARALAHFKTERVKTALLKALPDASLSVLTAASEGLSTFRLQRPTEAVLRLFSGSGRRVPAAAAELLARTETGPREFENILVNLDREEPATRQVLAHILRQLYGSDEGVSEVAARLRSPQHDVRRAAVGEATAKLAKLLLR